MKELFMDLVHFFEANGIRVYQEVIQRNKKKIKVYFLEQEGRRIKVDTIGELFEHYRTLMRFSK